jgi:hypothetical protein
MPRWISRLFTPICARHGFALETSGSGRRRRSRTRNAPPGALARTCGPSCGSSSGAPQSALLACRPDLVLGGDPLAVPCSSPISAPIRSESCAAGIRPHWCVALGQPSRRPRAGAPRMDTQLAEVTPSGSVRFGGRSSNWAGRLVPARIRAQSLCVTRADPGPGLCASPARIRAQGCVRHPRGRLRTDNATAGRTHHSVSSPAQVAKRCGRRRLRGDVRTDRQKSSLS